MQDMSVYCNFGGHDQACIEKLILIDKKVILIKVFINFHKIYTIKRIFFPIYKYRFILFRNFFSSSFMICLYYFHSSSWLVIKSVFKKKMYKEKTSQNRVAISNKQ